MARTASAAPEPGRRRGGPQPRGRLVQRPEFRRWMAGLDRESRIRVMAHARRAHADRTRHRRPLVDTLKGSRMHNLKELRITATMRVLFAADDRRNTVLLVGGDKAGQEKRFYRQAIPQAEKEFAAHLNRIGKEAPWPSRNPPNHRPPNRER